jgi:hypothetical protein
MPKRILLLVGALAALLALPAMAGASVAFTRLTAPYTFSSQPLNPAIWVANNNGSASRKLPVTGSDPLISPDGKMVAYLVTSTPNYSWTLHFVTIATGVDVNTKTNCENPAWAPNSSAVSCSTTSKSLSGLIVVTPAGKVTVIAKSSSSAQISWNPAAWSPDSSMVAWTYELYKSKNARPNPVLRAMRVDGTGSILKLGNGIGAVWGPSRIAFYRYTGSSDNMITQIWTVSPTGGASSAKQLTHWKPPTNQFLSGPTPMMWTPDGSKIVGAVTGMDDDANSIVVNASSGAITTLGTLTAYSNRPEALAADGSSVLLHYYSQNSATNKAYGTINNVSINGKTSTLFLNHVTAISASADWKP